MKKTVTKEICDLCKKEVSTEEYIIPVYRSYEKVNGKTIYYTKDQFSNEKLDICEECINEITFVRNIGVECNEYEIRPTYEYRKNTFK